MATVVDRLTFYHPDLEQALTQTYLAWGEIPRVSSEDRVLRVKNLSYTYTAHEVTIRFTEQGIGDPLRSVAAQHYLSLDGETFTATVNVGNLDPQAMSEIVTVRRVTAPDADLGFGDVQLIAEAAAWSA